MTVESSLSVFLVIAVAEIVREKEESGDIKPVGFYSPASTHIYVPGIHSFNSDA